MSRSVTLGFLWEPAGGWFGEVKLLWALRTLDPLYSGTIFSFQISGRDSSLSDCLVPWGMIRVSQVAFLRATYNRSVGHRWLQFGITTASLNIISNIPLLTPVYFPQNSFYCQFKAPKFSFVKNGFFWCRTWPFISLPLGKLLGGLGYDIEKFKS